MFTNNWIEEEFERARKRMKLRSSRLIVTKVPVSQKNLTGRNRMIGCVKQRQVDG